MFARDHSGAEYVRLVTPETVCPLCSTHLAICETRVRYVQTMEKLLRVEGKGKRCTAEGGAHAGLRFHSPDLGRLVLKGQEFGRDVVMFSGDQHLRENLSIPRIHRRLVEEFHIPISERTVGNQVECYVGLCSCVAGDTERLRERLKRQGGIVLAVDGVHFDAASPVLYVQRDVLSDEVLYAERRLSRSKDDLLPMLRRTAALAAEIGVPILGVVSDKETSVVPAIAEVFVGVPHQFCQTHFLSNVAEPLKADDRELAAVAKETVLELRRVQRKIERLFPAVKVAVGRPLPEAQPEPQPAASPAAEGDGGSNGRSGTDDGLAEATVASALARAGTAVGAVYGRAITDPPGLKRFKRLQEVRAAAEKAAKKRGLRKAVGR